jgi:hypothetical protein
MCMSTHGSPLLQYFRGMRHPHGQGICDVLGASDFYYHRFLFITKDRLTATSRQCVCVRRICIKFV